MIVFDLKCAMGHVFEAWFGSSADFEDQRGRGLLVCPLCGDAAIEKAVMAPNVPAKSNTRGETAPLDPRAVKAALAALAAAQSKALEGSTWVGAAFAKEARAMHESVREETPIHGKATLAEARALIEDGIPVAPLPLPIPEPSARN